MYADDLFNQIAHFTNVATSVESEARKKADQLHEIWGADWEQIEEHMISDGFSDITIAKEIDRLQDNYDEDHK